eukprot:XP_002604140.1 hypothetical protein BRAFLDRAFT_71567 [Branchiostoma floridae]
MTSNGRSGNVVRRMTSVYLFKKPETDLRHFGLSPNVRTCSHIEGYKMEGTDLTQELQTVADYIGKDWKRLLRRLGMKDNDLDLIHHDYMDAGLVEMVYQGLRKWTQQDGERATLQKLLAGLEMIRRRDLVNMLSAGADASPSVLSQIRHDLPEHTVPKQPMSAGIPCSARFKKRKHLPGFLKTLVKST